MKWLKWFRRVSDDKSVAIKLTPLCFSVMYNLLDFSVSLHPTLPHKIVKEIYLFGHSQSPHHFPFWNPSLTPTYPSALAILCAQSMQMSASEWSRFLLLLLFSANSVIHILVIFLMCHCVLNRTSFFFLHPFKGTSQNLTSAVLVDNHYSGISEQVSYPQWAAKQLCEKRLCYTAFWSASLHAAPAA